MKNKLFIVLVSITAAFWIVLNGYGFWQDDLKINGKVNTLKEFKTKEDAVEKVDSNTILPAPSTAGETNEKKDNNKIILIDNENSSIKEDKSNNNDAGIGTVIDDSMQQNSNTENNTNEESGDEANTVKDNKELQPADYNNAVNQDKSIESDANTAKDDSCGN